MHDLSIAAVLEHYGADLTRVSEYGWHTIRCPFHADNHPSARVSLREGGFWCPVCGIKGDAIKIIEIQETLDFKGACQFAQTVLGVSGEVVRETTPRPKARRRPKRRRSLFDE